MSMMYVGDKDYSDGRTKQSFKDETDINKILKKAQRAGTLSHLQRHGAVYGDFSDVPDLLTAHERLKNGQAIYDELPSELRREFPDMFQFFEFVNDPANGGVDPETGRSKLQEILPDLARPGRQNPAVRRSAATEANPAISSAEPAAAPETPPSSAGDGGPPASSTT